MAPRTLLVTATLAALALAAPLHESRNSDLRMAKRLEGEIVPQTGTVKHGCLTRHEWNPPPSETNPTACGYSMDKINQLIAEGKFYISLPEDVWLTTKTAQWPNPICGKQVTVKNLNTNKEQKGIVMDRECAT